MEKYPNNEVKHEENMRTMLESARKAYDGRDMLRLIDKKGSVRGVKADEFLSDRDALGNGLLSLGLAGAHIAVLGPTSCGWLLSYYTILCGVGVVVPVDKELPDGEIANVLRMGDVSALIYAGEYADTVAKLRSALPDVHYFINIDGPEEDERSLRGLISAGRKIPCGYESRPIDEHALAALLFTSGTTGKSKGVMLTQHNILSASEGALRLLDLGKVCMSVLPVHHSYESTHGITMMIREGITVCVSDSLRHFARNLQIFKPDLIFLVPLFVEMMHRKIWQSAEDAGTADALRALLDKSREEMKNGIDNRKEYFKSIRDAFGGNLDLIICGGAPLSARLAREFREFGILLLEGYGITECAPLVAVNRNRYFKDGAAGVPIACCEVRVGETDENGEGEIYVRGENVMLGYYKNDAATAEAIRDGWFDTGDIGHIDDDGFLFITGRKKNLIVLSNGKNVYPEEIEEYFMRIPYIKEIVVYAPVSDGAETELTAEIFPAEEFTASHSTAEVHDTLERDISAINKTLPVFQQLTSFHVRDKAFEKTTKQSIKRFTIDGAAAKEVGNDGGRT